MVSHAQLSKTNIVKTIVLDPGHGGKDPGNLGTKRYKTTEKDIALSITLLVGKYLNQAFPEMNIIYTRDDDSYPELIERTKLANEKGYALITCNSAGNNAFFVKRNLLNEKVKEVNCRDAFRERKFRESRDKNNKLTYLDNKEQKKLISHLYLEEV